jgi:tRNA (guanine-N7-)-methyltransferase
MWRERGIDIKYLCFELPLEGELVEPEVDIPLDEYRSYNRSKRSGNDTGR